ncbi:hypothetical protein [Paenibacillus sp. USDA918EY]|uniref:hypothetical protein n=1 Tax=Paenibacillus sp. USDA918EY TaxID=2689575 RepID=UPI001F1B3D23|nr:hypothetical protein [Paenibacillus sp. USDA918EY]
MKSNYRLGVIIVFGNDVVFWLSGCTLHFGGQRAGDFFQLGSSALAAFLIW